VGNQDDPRPTVFERTIADLLLWRIEQAAKDAPTTVLLQGPMLPKLRGRIAYRSWKHKARIYAITYDPYWLKYLGFASATQATMEESLQVQPPFSLDAVSRGWLMTLDSQPVYIETITNMDGNPLHSTEQDAEHSNEKSLEPIIIKHFRDIVEQFINSSIPDDNTAQEAKMNTDITLSPFIDTIFATKEMRKAAEEFCQDLVYAMSRINIDKTDGAKVTAEAASAVGKKKMLLEKICQTLNEASSSKLDQGILLQSAPSWFMEIYKR